MANSHVITNRTRLDAFLRAGGQLDDIELAVGQLSGKPKYPKGHVGRRSRDESRRGRAAKKIDDQEKYRRSIIREGRRQLKGLTGDQRKVKLAQMRAALKSAGMSSRSLARKSAARTPVARVAGVLASEGNYHTKAIVQRRPVLRAELEHLRGVLLKGGNVAGAIKTIGKNTKAAVRREFQATGHVDTGRVLRNIQYQLITKAGKKAFVAARKAARIARKAANGGRRG